MKLIDLILSHRKEILLYSKIINYSNKSKHEYVSLKDFFEYLKRVQKEEITVRPCWGDNINGTYGTLGIIFSDSQNDFFNFNNRFCNRLSKIVEYLKIFIPNITKDQIIYHLMREIKGEKQCQ